MHDGRQESRGGAARRLEGAVPERRGGRGLRRCRTALHGHQRVRARRQGERVDPRHRGEGEDAQGDLRHGSGCGPRAPHLEGGAGARGHAGGRGREGRREARTRRARPQGARLSRRQLHRAHGLFRREDVHDHLQGGDLRPGAVHRLRGYSGRGHRLHQRQPLRQRHGHLHAVRRRGAQVPVRDRRGTGRHQRAHSGAGALLQLHRFARLQARRPGPLRQAGDAVLHAGEDGHGALVRRRGDGRRGQHHHQPEVAAMKIGFIGLGNMGNPMCRNLLKHGHTVKAHDVVPALAAKAASHGAERAGSIAECVSDVDVVITMLPSSPHVRTVYCGESGVIAHAKAGTLLIDSSTIDPLTAREVAFDALARGLPMVDAPVSGGTAGAEAGTLTFMVGGSAKDFEAARAVLSCMGTNIVHCGGSGNGQVAKICNNMMLAVEMIATSEAMTLATALGMDAKVFAGIVNTSSGRCWSSDTYNPYPGVLENAPASRGYTGGFGADLMLKDLSLVTDAARSAKVPVLLGAIAQQVYQKHSADGHGGKDFSSVILQYLKATGPQGPTDR
ncbi:MAG: 3-hydroxyisobutyrate dehydrogenase [Betaproteobacteria bacterium]|nr:3-hydroxyisobutyrate dehydrogenase [Betaproteobacteria bacterium]